MAQVQSSAAEAPANPLVLGILLFGSTISALSFTAVTAGLPRIAAHFTGHEDDMFWAQLVLTMATIGMAIGGILSGWVTALFGVRRALFIGLVGCGVFGMAPLVLDNLYAIYVSRFLIGWSTVTVDICLTTILSARYEGEARARVIGFKQAVGSTFTVTGTLLCGRLVQDFGWRASFWVFALAFVYLVIAVIAFRKPIARTQSAPGFDVKVIGALWPFYLATILLAVAHTMPHFELPFLLVDDGMTNVAEVAYFPATSAGVSILSAMAFGFIYGRAGRWTLVILLTAMGIGISIIGVAPSFAFVFACVVIEGFGGGLMIPFLSTRILEKAPPEIRSQGFGLMLSSMFIGQFFNPVVNKPLREVFGIHESFVIVGATLLVVAIAITLASLRTRPIGPRPADL